MDDDARIYKVIMNQDESIRTKATYYHVDDNIKSNQYLTGGWSNFMRLAMFDRFDKRNK